MSTSHRHHIPFPKNFLSLNARLHQTPVDNVFPPSAEATPHNFLSNRPVVPRHASVSSVTSVSSNDSAVSAPSSPPVQAAASPILAPAMPAFLALNHKYSAPPTTSQALNLSGEKSAFLSNRG
ncbi:hypothetical protein K491DRAFT_116500 [Lophiostoma macrostomum CBS 122681]|uniref:Uncharacterized protein n=1 Tax=Lophiostoma macrostomum CBS 122681 TaxID=1314788 RepID=A0A6A6ST48_9PLEO|nr:hypothetical protein K491DRAFT_116500 [Lophiostoma macrostomum CBS 122681]